MSWSILCAYYQWRISSTLDSPEGRSSLPLRHLARCPACREFHERSVALGVALRGAAADAAEKRRQTPFSERRKRSQSPFRWAWAAGVTAAACVVALVLAWSNQRPRSPQIVNSPPKTPTTAPAVAYTQEDATRALAAVSDPLVTLRELARAPIGRQVQNVRTEAQAAGRFLASCLPVAVEGDKKN